MLNTKEHKNPIDTFPCLRFTGRQKYPGEYNILYCDMYCQKTFISIFILFFYFLAVKACMLTTQPKVCFVQFLVVPCPLGWFSSRITNLCIFAKSLFDDALPATRNGLNSHQRRDTDLGEFGEILF